MVLRVIFGVICSVLLYAMIFRNDKVKLSSLLNEQLKVFTDRETNDTSLNDILCFIVFPILIGIFLPFCLECVITNELASIFTTVFSIIFTILFGFASLLGTKLDTSDGIVKRVAKETFVSLMTCQILAIIATVLSICIINGGCALYIKILSAFIWSFALMMLMLILMVTKRTYKLYSEGEKKANSGSDKKN